MNERRDSLVFDLEVQMAGEPVVEQRFLDVARSIQLHAKPAGVRLVRGDIHHHVIRLSDHH